MDYQYSDNYAQRPRKRPQLDSKTTEAAVNITHPPHTMVHAESSKKEYYKFAGVILVIALCATIMSVVVGFDWQEWMRWFMGGFFVFFGSFKLIGYDMFIRLFPTYDPIGKRFKYYTYGYPFIELMLGFLYCANLYPVFRDTVTVTLLSIGAWGVLKNLPRGGEAIKCACLGNVIKLPLSTVTLIEDVTMASMGLIMLISNFVL